MIFSSLDHGHVQSQIQKITTFCSKVVSVTTSNKLNPSTQNAWFSQKKSIYSLKHTKIADLTDEMLFDEFPSSAQTPRKAQLEKPISEDSIWNPWFDNLICNLVSSYKRDWNRIHKSFVKKTGMKICKIILKNRFREIDTRGKNYMKPFKVSEDKQLLDIVEKVGSNWKKIAEYFPERNSLALKNRFYYLKRTYVMKDVSFQTNSC